MVPSLCHDAPAHGGARGGRFSSWQCSGIWSHQGVQGWDGTKDSQCSVPWAGVDNAMCVPALARLQHRAWHLRSFPPHGLLKLVLIAGLLLAIISQSVKSAWGLMTGGKTSRRSSFARPVCTWVKGAAAKLRYKICVVFKIKCLYGLRGESRCWAGVAQPGPDPAGPCAVPIHLHKTTETFSVV